MLMPFCSCVLELMITIARGPISMVLEFMCFRDEERFLVINYEVVIIS